MIIVTNTICCKCLIPVAECSKSSWDVYCHAITMQESEM